MAKPSAKTAEGWAIDMEARSKEWLNRSYPRNGEAIPFYPYVSPVYQFNQLLRGVRQ